MSITLIRTGVFETNSSSCHTVSIGRGDAVLTSISPDDEGNIAVEPGEFGWDQGVRYFKPEDKLAYLLIYCREWAEDKDNRRDYEEREAEAESGLAWPQDVALLPEKTKRFYNVLSRVVIAHTGATNARVLLSNEDAYYHFGYIDHQSVEKNNLDFLFAGTDEANQLLRLFLFDPTSYVETDNDNHE